MQGDVSSHENRAPFAARPAVSETASRTDAGGLIDDTPCDDTPWDDAPWAALDAATRRKKAKIDRLHRDVGGLHSLLTSKLAQIGQAEQAGPRKAKQLGRLRADEALTREALARKQAQVAPAEAAYWESLAECVTLWRRQHLQASAPEDGLPPPALRLAGFERDPAIAADVRGALRRNEFAQAFDGIVAALGIERHALLLTETVQATRRGRSCCVVRLRYDYNPAVNEVLKATGRAYFDRARSLAWDVVLDGPSVSLLEARLPAHFAAVIDLDTHAVLVRPAAPAMVPRPCEPFRLIHHPVAVDPAEVERAIHAARKADPLSAGEMIAGSLQAHSATLAGFVPFSFEGHCYTRMPFLLLQYRTPGWVHHAVFLTRQRTVAEFTTHGRVTAYGGFVDRTAGQLVADYLEVAYIHDIPAFVLDERQRSFLASAAGAPVDYSDFDEDEDDREDD